MLVTIATDFCLGVHLPEAWMRSSRPTRLGPYQVSLGSLSKIMPRPTGSSATQPVLVMEALAWKSGRPLRDVTGSQPVLA